VSAKSRPVGRPLVEFVFMAHVAEVEHLLSLSTKQKRRRDAEVINRAAVVFLVAVWQTYVEALADDLSRLLTGSTTKERLNTPNSKNVDALFNNRFGLPSVSTFWRWRGMTCARARHRLDKILALRHQIAHKARVLAPVKKSTVLGYLHFMHRLAICLYNHTARHSAAQLGIVTPRPIAYSGIVGQFGKG
jgi:hypothetical protein